jgi:signal transduction histidine kinase
MQPCVEQNSLRSRACWLVRLRWFAAIGVVLGTFASAEILQISVREGPLYSLAVLLVLYNAATSAVLGCFTRAGCDKERRWLKSLINLQISADLVILTILLHFSGGPENPLMFFFTFHMIIASILLSVWESYMQATLAVASFGCLLLLEATGRVPHHCLRGFVEHCRYEEKLYLAGTFGIFAVTLFLVVYMAGYIAVRLRRAEEAQRLANGQLREKDRLKDEYVAHVTHDIKGHLAAIQSCLGVAAGGSSNDETASFIDRAYRRTEKLTVFVRMLLRLTRLKLDGKMEMEVFCASAAVREAVEAVRLGAREKSLCLKPSIGASPAAVVGSEISFKEAITSLLLNSIKYTPAEGTVSVRMEVQAETATIEIADTGIGIPQSEQARVFEEFYRAGNARQMESDGDGLGLSLVKRVIELHGGTIDLASELGRGTVFRIVLPLAARGPATDGPGQIAAGSPESGLPAMSLSTSSPYGWLSLRHDRGEYATKPPRPSN